MAGPAALQTNWPISNHTRLPHPDLRSAHTLHYNVSMLRRDEFARTLVGGTYDLVVLDLLRAGPNYGYGIRQRILRQSNGTVNWRDGTLYPVLRHLEKQGLVASAWNRPRTGRQRRYYRLTPLGRRVWQARRRQWDRFTHTVNSLLTR